MSTFTTFLASFLRRSPPRGEPLSDADLLTRFAQTEDAAAFELLVWRHGSMVLGVCKRMLRHEHSAEDAFQAVFLILAKKAGVIRSHLGGWLHTTARRVCLRLKKRTQFVALEQELMARTEPEEFEQSEMWAIVDSEIARLPEKFRLAVILCYLQGHSTEQAASELDVPRGTVLSRLASARKRLATRLTRRGLTLPATFLTTTFAGGELSAELCHRTAEAALSLLTHTLPGTLPTQLAMEVLTMTTRKTILGSMAALVLLAGVGTGLTWVIAEDTNKASKDQKPQASAGDPPPADRKVVDREAMDREAKLKEIQDAEKKRMAKLSFLKDASAELEKEIQKLETVRTETRAALTRGTPTRVKDELIIDLTKKLYDAQIATKLSELELEEAKELLRKVVGERGDQTEQAHKEAIQAQKVAFQRCATQQVIWTQKVRVIENTLAMIQKNLHSGEESELALQKIDQKIQLRQEQLRKLQDLEFDLRFEEFKQEKTTGAGDDKLDKLFKQINELRQEIKQLQPAKK